MVEVKPSLFLLQRETFSIIDKTIPYQDVLVSNLNGVLMSKKHYYKNKRINLTLLATNMRPL